MDNGLAKYSAGRSSSFFELAPALAEILKPIRQPKMADDVYFNVLTITAPALPTLSIQLLMRHFICQMDGQYGKNNFLLPFCKIKSTQ